MDDIDNLLKEADELIRIDPGFKDNKIDVQRTFDLYKNNPKKGFQELVKRFYGKCEIENKILKKKVYLVDSNEKELEIKKDGNPFLSVSFDSMNFSLKIEDDEKKYRVFEIESMIKTASKYIHNETYEALGLRN